MELEDAAASLRTCFLLVGSEENQTYETVIFKARNRWRSQLEYLCRLHICAEKIWWLCMVK